MGSPAGFCAALDLDELQNIVDNGSGARSVATRQAAAQYNLGLNGTNAAMTAGTVKASSIVVVDANKDIGSFRNVVAVNYDAGADAVAGTVDIFPTTTASGKIQIAAADSAGAFTLTITNASMAAARTVTIPDPGASASFVMTAGNQTVGGAKTYTGGPVITTSNMTITDVNIALSTGTGTKIGTATGQKLGFFNATPVIQQATTATVTGYTSVGGSAVLSQSTFTGNTGTAAYTIGDIVLALKNLGLMAA